MLSLQAQARDLATSLKNCFLAFGIEVVPTLLPHLTMDTIGGELQPGCFADRLVLATINKSISLKRKNVHCRVETK
jgi:hypothetical protein